MLGLPFNAKNNIEITKENSIVPCKIPVLHFILNICNFYLAPEDVNKAICIDNTNVKVKLAFHGALLWFIGEYFDERLMISFQLREVLTAARGKTLEIIGVVTLVIHIGMQLYLEK